MLSFLQEAAMARRRKSLIPGLSWSWKRAIGISGLKSKIAQKTGVPLTKGGLQRKVGGAVLKPLGCLVPLVALSSSVVGGFYFLLT